MWPGCAAVLAVAVAGLGIFATFYAGAALRQVSKELQKPQAAAAPGAGAGAPGAGAEHVIRDDK